MTIIILGDLFTFPDGQAATNRVYAFAKGYLENGAKVHVICFDNIYTTDFFGEKEGINYYYPFKQSIRNNSFFIRRWQNLKKYFNTLAIIKSINKKEKITVIKLWTYSFLIVLFTFFICKIYKTKVILESSENPLKDYQSHLLNKKLGLLNIWLQSKLCDGVFCISNYLMNFHKDLNNSVKLILIPSIVDIDRFNNVDSPSPFNFKYIAYCGVISLTQNKINKDGVDILIKAFKTISLKFNYINLVLIGKPITSEDELIIKGLINQLNLENRVILTGEIHRQFVPSYILNAELLALARPASIVADAGFPTKLTEYLATGRPIVVTEVGDIPVYLKDNENAFLSKPNDAAAFAQKLDFILCNYGFAQKVGQKGKELTETIFNYNYQAKRMIGFINSL